MLGKVIKNGLYSNYLFCELALVAMETDAHLNFVSITMKINATEINGRYLWDSVNSRNLSISYTPALEETRQDFLMGFVVGFRPQNYSEMSFNDFWWGTNIIHF